MPQKPEVFIKHWRIIPKYRNGILTAGTNRLLGYEKPCTVWVKGMSENSDQIILWAISDGYKRAKTELNILRCKIEVDGERFYERIYTNGNIYSFKDLNNLNATVH